MSGRAVTLLVASLFVSSCADEGAPSGAFVPYEETAVAQSSATGVPGTTPGQAVTQVDAGTAVSNPGAPEDAGVPLADDGGETMLDAALPNTEEDAALGSEDAGEAEHDADVEDDAGDEPVLAGPGMPCAVKAVYYERCVGCHSNTNGRAGVSVVTRTQLMGRSTAFPDQTIAERTVARMHDPERPMPPKGERVADADIAAIEAWIADGMPETSCDQ